MTGKGSGRKRSAKAPRKRQRKRVVTEWVYDLVCEWCGETFEATNPQAKTCSTSCRVSLHRARKRNADSGGRDA